MIGEEGPLDEKYAGLDIFRPRRNQRKTHFAEVYNERISEQDRDTSLDPEQDRDLPLDAEMYDDLLREEILVDM